MKKQNGFTSIELLVSFIVVSAITISLFDLILNYRNKQQIVAYETTIQSFINTTTKMIQDDLIKRKLRTVSISGSQVTFTLQDALEGSTSTRLILSQSGGYLQYGATGSEIRYNIPNIADLKIKSYQFRTIGSASSQFVSLEIVFTHPNFEQQKRILITAPVNYPA